MNDRRINSAKKFNKGKPMELVSPFYAIFLAVRNLFFTDKFVTEVYRDKFVINEVASSILRTKIPTKVNSNSNQL
jgi:hypothetical protein